MNILIYMTVYFFTLYNDINKIKYLQETSYLNNIKLTHVVLSKWNGFHDKIILLKDAIIHLKDSDIVCFIDAYDTLFLYDERTIEKLFLSFECNILFSSEKVCFPHDNIDLYKKDNLLENCYPFLNSGCYIGYKKYIIQMLSWKDRNDIEILCQNGGDQNYFTLYYFDCHSKENIKLDTNQKIFQSMCNINYFEEMEMKNGKLYNIYTNSFPCILHFNGFGDMDTKKMLTINSEETVECLETFISFIKDNYSGKILYKYPFMS
jgi:hypothetical protein